MSREEGPGYEHEALIPASLFGPAGSWELDRLTAVCLKQWGHLLKAPLRQEHSIHSS